MGCNQTVDYKCDDDEKTEEQSGKTISLGAFYIDKYEVTVAEYQRCVEAKEKGCTPPHIGCFCNWPKTGRENLPMNCVDWNQATAYCEWAGKQLPTEAQWEKAARGTDGRVYPWGNEWDAKKANVGDNNGTVAVGLYSPGANGLYDMAGNVWEWVQDWYGADYYKSSPDRNPKGPSKGDSKVLRGGSWGYDPWGARVSARHKKAPSYRSDLIGFRCAQ